MRRITAIFSNPATKFVIEIAGLNFIAGDDSYLVSCGDGYTGFHWKAATGTA